MKRKHYKNYEEFITNRRLFILGAGFSAGAGIPLTDKLLKLTFELFHKESDGLFGRFKQHIQACLMADTKPNYSRINIFELCTFLEYIELREYGGGERWSNSGSREKLALKYYLSRTIIENTPRSNNIPDVYIKFVSQLREGDLVISFNWDCLLEVALKMIGRDYTYNFESGKICLCKLHGSLNWRLHEPRAPYKLNWKPIGFSSGIMSDEIYHSDELLCHEKWCRHGAFSEIEPYIILPGYGKAFDVRALSVLWYKPEFAFATTHDIYMIGLGLAEDDFFLRSFFKHNIPYIEEYTGVKGRKIIIINPDPNTKKKYKFILKHRNATVINEPFALKHIDMMNHK